MYHATYALVRSDAAYPCCLQALIVRRRKCMAVTALLFCRLSLTRFLFPVYTRLHSSFHKRCDDCRFPRALFGPGTLDYTCGTSTSLLSAAALQRIGSLEECQSIFDAKGEKPTGHSLTFGSGRVNSGYDPIKLAISLGVSRPSPFPACRR